MRSCSQGFRHGDDLECCCEAIPKFFLRDMLSWEGGRRRDALSRQHQGVSAGGIFGGILDFQESRSEHSCGLQDIFWKTSTRQTHKGLLLLQQALFLCLHGSAICRPFLRFALLFPALDPA